ncbi:MAG: hypothetical protein RR951_00090 [Ruthenibacterium sp.]
MNDPVNSTHLEPAAKAADGIRPAKAARQAPSACSHKASPVRFFACAVGVILAATLFLRFGPNRAAVRLEVPDTKGILNGFALSGTVGDAFYSNRFSCKDGMIENHFALKPTPHYFVTGSNTYAKWAVAPQAHEEVDLRAKKVTDSGGAWSSTCVDFVCVIEMNTQQGALRILPGITYRSPDQITVGANSVCHASRQDSVLDYSAYVQWQANQRGVPLPPQSSTALANGIPYLVCGGGAGVAPALYRVDEVLSEKQLRALPKDGMVQGNPVLMDSTPYGKATEVHRFSPDTRICSMGGVGDFVCVAAVEENTVKFLLLNKDGDIVDTYDTGIDAALREQPAEQTQTADPFSPGVQFFPQQAADELCFSICRIPAMNNNDTYYGGLRVKDGKFVAACSTALIKSEYQQESLMTELGVTLREDNKAILVMQEQALVAYSDPESKSGRYLPEKVLLTVYEQGAKLPLGKAALTCNQRDDWNPAQMGINHSAHFTDMRQFSFGDFLQSYGLYMYFTF